MIPLSVPPAAAHWLLLIAGSALFAFLLRLAGLPAALLLGPMLAGIILAVRGVTLRIPRTPYFGAQALVGCLIASTITPAILSTIVADWPLLLGSVVAVIAASMTLGWLMSHWQLLPGSTSIWGSAPGGASAMTLMAEAFGADIRLVAFMQYLRIVFVALAASAVAALFVPGAAHAAATPWFPPLHVLALLETLAVAGGGAVLGKLLRIPAGALLLPLFAASLLHASGRLAIELPPWLLSLGYAFIGWNIGLGFTRQILRHALRALPQILLSILLLIAFCGGLGFVLTAAIGTDPLTAYLATSPGGMDAIAIIAASSKVDLPFVMALQTLRMVIVILVGPPLARMMARRVGEGRS